MLKIKFLFFILFFLILIFFYNNSLLEKFNRISFIPFSKNSINSNKYNQIINHIKIQKKFKSKYKPYNLLYKVDYELIKK